MASIIVNLITGLGALAAVAVQVKRSSFRSVMKFFTAQSNVFCAFCCLAVAVFRLLGDAPRTALIFKYVGTSAVTVTLLTVFLFLSGQYGLKPLLAGPDLWLHLLCPALAIVSFLAWDHPAMGFPCVFLGTLPVLLYGALYLKKVVFDPLENRWDDFYGFNRGGKWPVSMACMFLGSFLISLILWAL